MNIIKQSAITVLILLQANYRIYSQHDLHESVFTHIYTHALWGKNEQGEGFSGGGSLYNNAKPYIQLLEKFLKEHDITSVVDAGCGDWQFSKQINWEGIYYRGYDVVEYVINKNKKLFEKPNIEFFHLNFITHELPEADLLVCKEVLQHLSNDDILAFIPQFSKYKYCLITNEVYPQTLTSHNPNIVAGKSNKIDLSQPPFNVKGRVLLNYKIGGEVHQVFFIDNTQEFEL